jgi:signal peptidase I
LDPEDRRARHLRRGIAVAFLGALFLLLLHALVFEVFQVGGTSMDPTLRERDRVVVLKVVEPRRGQLVVFRLDQRNVIKRVVAVPGERVEIRRGHVLVNGAELEETYLVHPFDQDPRQNHPELVVEPGHLFVLGDNRVASTDSRTLGPIDARTVVGRAVIAFWPPRWL